jgi:glutathione S-transferase
MPVNYVDFEQAKDSEGLRLIVMPGIPSPWSEAAKGILHVKGIDYQAIYLDHQNKDMSAWAKTRSAPVAVFNDEKPRNNWLDILLLAERLQSEPALLPTDEEDKAIVIGLCHMICGENGLGWLGRLDSVHKGLTGQPGGFVPPVAQYLAAKYGYAANADHDYEAGLIRILETLSTRLKRQHEVGSRYLFGEALTALDIYFSTFIAYFSPLSEEHCPMLPAMRDVFSANSAAIEAALDPVLIQHRDFIYQTHLELPLSL